MPECSDCRHASSQHGCGGCALCTCPGYRPPTVAEQALDTLYVETLASLRRQEARWGDV